MLGATTAYGGLGSFVDDDGLVAGLASFVATSVGAPGSDGRRRCCTWHDITEGPLPPGGAARTTARRRPRCPAAVWGQEKEVTRIDRLAEHLLRRRHQLHRLVLPELAGSSVTSVGRRLHRRHLHGRQRRRGVHARTRSARQAISLDSTALSVGRGRRDIENLTQAANIDIPVIAFGGSNGLAPVPGSYIAVRAAASAPAPRRAATARRASSIAHPEPGLPDLRRRAGGFEVVITEGFAHVDVVTAEDDADNPVPAALVAFLQRNIQ